MEVLNLSANKHYKDSVFSLYLGEPERLIEVFNAVEGTNYPADTPVVINTLEDALWKNRINDLSFVLDGQIVILIEHQSTINNNMALRMLLYCARIYEKMLPNNAIYRRSLITIPTPRFVVLYNGADEFPEHEVQYLSEAFAVQEESPMLQLKVDIYNINYNKSPQLIQKSKSLMDYSLFIHAVKQEQAAGQDFSDAVRNAIRYCIAHDIMKEFLSQHGSEVENMLFTEWNMDEALAVATDEGREQGRKEGRKEGQEEGIKKSIRLLKDVLSPEIIAEKFSLPLDYVQRILQEKQEIVH
jgi:predicted transposase/invertase (TIGR01784 family)